MKIDYDVGDVVVCVNASRTDFGVSVGGGKGLKLGALYRVVKFSPHRKNGVMSVSLQGDGNSQRRPSRFRRLPKADAEFTEQMRRCKPAKQKVDA